MTQDSSQDEGGRRRLMTRAEAAEYCHLKPGSFDRWVAAGRLPKALAGTKRWDRKALDAALDRMSGLGEVSETPLQRWRRSRGHASAA